MDSVVHNGHIQSHQVQRCRRAKEATGQDCEKRN